MKDHLPSLRLRNNFKIEKVEENADKKDLC